MTERTTIDAGAIACPFVAFDDDRDERSDQPDHRHRCYAEIRPAPRAIAHQAAFCLSGGFAACPTFQDWARREAARSRAAADAAAAAGEGTDDDDQPERNPHRDWAAPPPWVAGGAGAASGSAAEPVPPAFLTRSSHTSTDPDASVEVAGLAASRWLDDGSRAGSPTTPDPDDLELERALAEDRAARERLALDRGSKGSAGAGPAAAGAVALDPGDPAAGAPSDVGPWSAAGVAAGATVAAGAATVGGSGATEAKRGGSAASARPAQATRRRSTQRDLTGPSWEQPRRFEAYPTIRTRMGLPSVPRLALAGLAVLVAAGVLFAVPFLLRSSDDNGVAASPSPSASAEASGEVPSAAVVPTPVVYTVKQGDTMSKIAKKYGVTVAQILAANKAIKNANRISPGDKITIPVALPSEILDGGSSPAP